MKLTKSKHLEQALADIGINRPSDALNHLPRRYLDFSLTSESSLANGSRLVLFGKATTAPVVNISRSYKIVTFTFLSLATNHQYKVIAFNRLYLRHAIKLGGSYTIIGTYDNVRLGINLVTFRQGVIPPNETICPVYQLPEAIAQHVFRNLLRRILPLAKQEVVETLPTRLIDKYRLMPKAEALSLAHFPTSMREIQLAFRTLKYEEALRFSLKTQLIRAQNRFMTKSIKSKIDLDAINQFIKKLPYKLSKDQTSSVREIVLDMNKDFLMYRLLQGDVGSGKTLVAAIALYANNLRGDQGALMAPTDALAKQHFRVLKELYKDTGLQVALLVGAMTRSERTGILELLLDGVIDIVVGTHALFSKDVIYQSLGLAIIDEQHRFGVNQRSLLSNKGDRADLLLMSATPIPRTLALTLYGDMDVTTIHQFPFAKREVTTSIHTPDDETLDKIVTASLSRGGRVFIVAPLIEDSEISRFNVESLYQEYNQTHRNKVVLLHGKMEVEDKDATLNDFASGKRPILVATSVIEVGIDVPSADVMIVYDAHRFGLASLHQLRGRIGRDGSAAKFILVTDIAGASEHERLRVLLESDDGFYIAEQDLKHRGPGELVGQRQAGIPSFMFLNIYNDYKMLEYARNDALELLSSDDTQARKLIEEARLALNDTPYA